jgi:hypothetical protein
MREKIPNAWLAPGALLIVLGFAQAQSGPQNRTLIVNGQPGQATVIQVNGRSYVDLEALARITNGSLAFKGNQVTLTLPGAATSVAATAPSNNQPANSGFSKDFLTAGIEEIAAIREWRSAIASAIRNGYPVADSWVASYRNQAAQGLRLTSVAVTTASDRSAFELLTN